MKHLDRLAPRATRALIDLDALAGNVETFRRLVPERVKLMAVVKANGYGHGAIMAARTALSAGATRLGVATVEEGVHLREGAISAPILVLGPIDPLEVRRALRERLSLAVGGPELVEAISIVAKDSAGDGRAALHLKIDTGMRRFGCLPDEAVAIARRIQADAVLRLEGVFTHFACADEVDERPTLDQAERFEATVKAIAAELSDTNFMRHAANSAATLRSRRYDFDMVRLGIAMYGAAPSVDVPLAPGLRPVMSIISAISRVIPLQAGERVSYGATYQAAKVERAALVPIGYADGYRRSLSNHGWMGIGGQTAPVRGRVCMDQTVIGLPPKHEARVGDEVVVVGPAGTGAPGWDELAEMTGTISYEMLTAISARVPRLHLQSGCPVAVENLSGLTNLRADDSD